MNTEVITKNITNDLMKYDFIRPFINLYYAHPRLQKKYPYIPLNFYFFNYKDRYYYHYDPDEGDHQYKKKFDFIHESITPTECKYAIFQDLYLFVGFRKLGHKILPFFFNVRHDPDSIVKNDYFNIDGFSTYDESSRMFSEYECINVSQFFKNDFRNVILRAELGSHTIMNPIPFETDKIKIPKRVADFESCIVNILRISRKTAKKK